MSNLFDKILTFRDDPLSYVYYAFPWENIEPLHDLEDWQKDVLTKVAHPGRYAISSGHGVGKGALVSLITLWFLSTHFSPSVVITANTFAQLQQKTWREVSIWHKRAINSGWFKFSGVKLALRENPDAHFAAPVTWSLDRPESIAGTHADDMLWIADEASAIPDIIWENAEGAMTTGRCWMIVLGNPTRRGTRFEKCFSDPRWTTWKIDSRECKRTNKFEIQKQIETYGEDSDFVRVRIKGEFPKKGFDQLISAVTVEQAYGRQIDASEIEPYPKILGVDPARMGVNKTAIIKRQGKAAFDLRYLTKRKTIYVANYIADIINSWDPDTVNIDSGNGGGIIDTLRNRGYRVNEVCFGGASIDPHYRNARTYMWCQMGDWLEHGGCLPTDPEMKKALPVVGYTYDAHGKKMLDKKSDMKKYPTGGMSDIVLDGPDSLALTFAVPVPMRATVTGRRRPIVDFNPLEDI